MKDEKVSSVEHGFCFMPLFWQSEVFQTAYPSTELTLKCDR